MFVTNHQSTTFPKDVDDYQINGTVVNIPVLLEYTAEFGDI
jgi:hypothetical protein